MSILEKTLRWIVIIGIFALPFICLLVTTSLFFPYITGKNFAFRIIVEIITGAWLALALIYPAYRPRRSWILGTFAIFVIIMAIADAQGVNPFKSFWSNFERMDGWVTLIHLLALLVVASSILTTERIWRRFWQLSLAVSLFVSIYGFLQIAGALALGQGGSAGLTARIDATFGNPIYLAIYMLFHIFVAALLFVQMRAEKSSRSLWLSVFYIVTIVLDTIALLFTGTRGTILGLIGGTAVALLLYSFTPAASAKFRRVTVIVLIVMVACAGLLEIGKNTSFVHSVGFLDRLASISTTDTTIASRFTNMSIAWQGIKEKPILGWGQENYAIVFDKYYDPRMYADEQWFDRVHDIIFDWWVAGGTLGLLAYLSILASTVWIIWKKSDFTPAERSIMTGMLAGYFVHNLTVFDNITSYILFICVLSYIVFRSTKNIKPILQNELLPQAALPFAAALCALLVWGIAWFTNANALAANRTLIQALTPQSSLEINLADFEQSIAYGTYGTQEAREQLIQGATQIATDSSIATATKQDLFDAAETQMRLQEQASPLDARFPLFLGVLEDSYGDYSDATTDLAKAQQLSPDKQTILFQIALNEQAMGDNADALATFKQAYELDTEDSDALLYYAAAAITDDQDSLADQLLAPLIPTGQAADSRITAAYASRNEFNKLLPIWQAYVKAYPTDSQGFFTLAAIDVQLGDKAGAIAALKQAEVVDPSAASQADGLIQQVQNGTASVQQ